MPSSTHPFPHLHQLDVNFVIPHVVTFTYLGGQVDHEGGHATLRVLVLFLISVRYDSYDKFLHSDDTFMTDSLQMHQ